MNSEEFRTLLAEKALERHVRIPDRVFESFGQYFGLMEKWNRKINLTALPLTHPTAETIDRLFVEPLEAVSWLEDSPVTWFDLGSGGGSPAIPIKIAKPRLKLAMVEAKSRKVAFLREVVRLLDLKETRVEGVRYQRLMEDQRILGTVDLVTARAVRIDREFIELAASLLRPRGRLALLSSSPGNFEPFFRATPSTGVFERCST